MNIGQKIVDMKRVIGHLPYEFLHLIIRPKYSVHIANRLEVKKEAK